MESDPWTALFSSKRHQSTLQSRSDLYFGFEEIDGDDDSRAEFPCPFCSEDFDIVGLCCHIDEEHPVEARNGVDISDLRVCASHVICYGQAGKSKPAYAGSPFLHCPNVNLALLARKPNKLGPAKVGMDMVGHITMQHGQFFKMQRRRRFRKGSTGSHSTLSLLRKELREGHLQSLLGGSSCVVSSSNAAPDPLLSSFIYNLPVADASKNVQPHSSDEGSSVKNDKVVESVEPSLSDKDQKEKAQRCEFVQELLLSTFLDDAL